MRVLLIGSGGRENAMAWKISKSPRLKKLFIAPGNPGTALLGENVDIDVENIEALAKFAIDEGIDLTIVGPEAPLVLGIVDYFKEHGLRIFGPSKAAAVLEGSKAAAKQFMVKHGIPTAAYGEYTHVDEAIGALPKFGLPVVIKADGLAAGKGVIICETAQDAVDTLEDLMTNKRFGEASERVVIEAFLKGTEASMICLVDGETIIPLEPAQDYKKVFDGDMGPNTGGMGAYCPSVLFDESLRKKVKDRILTPFINGVKAEGYDYTGVVFIGLMIDGDDINVIEFNVRFGDPETQVILPRLESDFLTVVWECIYKRLSEVELKWSSDKAVAVVLTSQGYPDAYRKGDAITGLDRVSAYVNVFHAGTKKTDGTLVTSGGRVMNVMAMAPSLEEARDKVYEAVANIKFEGMAYRKDIAKF